MIWKTSLSPRIGIIHATNRRNYSLNLDFADLFKPLLVDRMIFSLINTHQIKKEKHFEKTKDAGIYLNREGKYVFLNAFEEKLQSRISVDKQEYSYRQLVERELKLYQKYIRYDERYTPYKHY